MIKTGKLLKDNKGSALIMVFSVVLLLVSFGTITLLAGVSNSQMGARYRNWSQEYYEVDQKAENYVTEIDKVLNDAENYTREYFKNEVYSIDPEGSSNLEKIPAVFSGIQDLIYKYWNDDLCKGLPENHTQEEAEAYFRSKTYIDNLKPFINEGFKKLYYYYVTQMFNETNLNDLIKKMNSGDKYKSQPNKDELMVKSTVKTSGYGSWSEMPTYDIDEQKLTVDIKASLLDNTTLNTYKMVNAQLTVRLPEYQTITQTRMVPLRTNPIWTNAITAAGSIYFDGFEQVNIYGDLFAADKNAQTDSGTTAGLDDSLTEYQDNGIVSHGANVQVYGNIYSRGDVHVVKDNTANYDTHSYGSITVNKYDTAKSPIDAKKLAFVDKNTSYNLQNYYLKPLGKNILKNDIESFIPKYAQDGAIYNTRDEDGNLPSYIPFIYPDTIGGNVYCNSLTIDEGCNNANIKVNGHLTMRDDIHNDGTSSDITLNGNLIGISSESDKYGNPNASSSVTNNQPRSSNISLNGNIIVPGETYLKFDDYSRKDELHLSAPFYYQTGISVGSWGKDYEIYREGFSTKLAGEYDSQFGLYFRNGTVKPFNFFDGYNSENSEKVEHIQKFLISQTTIDTSMNVLNQVEGYVLGTVIAKAGTSPYSSAIKVSNTGANSAAFSELSQNSVLTSIMNAKTIGLGYSTNSKSVKAANSFGDYVNKNALSSRQNIIYYDSDDELVLNSTTNGIIYAEGNLKITGNGTFNGIVYTEGNLTITDNGKFYGTLICEGNVTIEDRPTITYSEAEIKKCLISNNSLREFFKPGESGQETYVDESSIDGIFKTTNVMRRYTINQWREEQVPLNNTNGTGQ